ncbi:MAG: hypothetical protein IGS03_15850 [Candidatus Sericytochromatia bacterium]|nr:hypothetical protein [Candidatus Sericytochromatia bacterium]
MSDATLIAELSSRELLNPPQEIGMSHAMTFLTRRGIDLASADKLSLPDGSDLPLQPLNALYSEARQPDQEARLVAISMAVEFAIAFADHDSGHALQDPEVIALLDKLTMKPETLQPGLGERIQAHLRLELSLADYSRSDVRTALRRCLRSAQRYHKSEGPRGYLSFIHHLIH